MKLYHVIEWTQLEWWREDIWMTKHRNVYGWSWLSCCPFIRHNKLTFSSKPNRSKSGLLLFEFPFKRRTHARARTRQADVHGQTVNFKNSLNYERLGLYSLRWLVYLCFPFRYDSPTIGNRVLRSGKSFFGSQINAVTFYENKRDPKGVCLCANNKYHERTELAYCLAV